MIDSTHITTHQQTETQPRTLIEHLRYPLLAALLALTTVTATAGSMEKEKGMMKPAMEQSHSMKDKKMMGDDKKMMKDEKMMKGDMGMMEEKKMMDSGKKMMKDDQGMMMKKEAMEGEKKMMKKEGMTMEK